MSLVQKATECSFNVIPPLLVFESALNEIGDERAPLASSDTLVKPRDNVVWERYVYSHVLTIARVKLGLEGLAESLVSPARRAWRVLASRYRRTVLRTCEKSALPSMDSLKNNTPKGTRFDGARTTTQAAQMRGASVSGTQSSSPRLRMLI